jgi:hypothetical protein
MSMTGFISFQMINVNLPSLGVSNAPIDQPPPPDKDPKLNLTVIMAPKGYYIAAKGGTLPDQTGIAQTEATAVDPNHSTPTIPTKGGEDFAYDYDKLRDLMTKVRQSNANVSQYFLAPDRSTKYDAVVKTMDAVRPAFPDVAFAAILK